MQASSTSPLKTSYHFQRHTCAAPESPPKRHSDWVQSCVNTLHQHALFTINNARSDTHVAASTSVILAACQERLALDGCCVISRIIAFRTERYICASLWSELGLVSFPGRDHS